MFKKYKVEVENQQNRKLKPLDLTVMESTMADTMDQVDFQNLLPIY